MASTNFAVIGVGAIGRQVGILLSATGANNITIFDPDKVSEENLGVQGYGRAALGHYKVDDVYLDMMKAHDASFVIREPRAFGDDPSQISWQSNYRQRNIVFCCVDSIDARKKVFECLLKEGFVGKSPGLIVDGRMAAETLRVFTWTTDKSPEEYRSSLFDSEESFKAPCTGRTTLYSSYVVAGLMVGEAVKWIRDEQPTVAQTFNLRASEHWCK